MKITAKKLTIGVTVSTLTLEHENTKNSCRASNALNALHCLLGGYNEMGRTISIEQYRKIKDQFDQAINDIDFALHY